MKLTHCLYTTLMGALTLAAASCTPDENSLVAVELTTAQLNEGSGFSVEVDQNTNYVTCKSLLPSRYSVYWEYGKKPAAGEEPSVSGTSTESVYRFGQAFGGEYYVRMAAETSGGIVYSEPAYFTLNGMNTDLISDQLWTLLTGGVGNSKTWILDLDPNDGSALKFGGPKWFYTAGQSWDSFHNAQGQNYLDADPWDATTAIDPSLSGEWYWAADYAGNSWMCALADYGEMTFDLDGGANVNVNGSKGSYYLDTDNHTISFTGTLPLSTGLESNIAAQCPSGVYKIVYLSENAMQILFDGPSETPFTMNYIAKSYKENYVAPVKTVINLPENWKDFIQPKNANITTYKFVEDDPYAWFTLGGEKIEGRTNFGANADINEAKIEINSKANVMSITDTKGDTYLCSYTLGSNGDFNVTAMPKFGIAASNADIKFGPQNNDNVLQVLTYEIDPYSGDITELYLGSRQYDAQGNPVEYLAYHLKKQTGAAEVERLPVNLGFAASGFAFIEHDPIYVTGEGTYTFSLTSNGSCDTQDPYLYYIDIQKLLKKHPNADIVITSIKVDGAEILNSVEGFDDATISRGIGDDATTGRRYLLNPWNETSASFTSLFKFSTSLDVTVNVKYDTGDVVLKAE